MCMNAARQIIRSACKSKQSAQGTRGIESRIKFQPIYWICCRDPTRKGLPLAAEAVSELERDIRNVEYEVVKLAQLLYTHQLEAAEEHVQNLLKVRDNLLNVNTH